MAISLASGIPSVLLKEVLERAHAFQRIGYVTSSRKINRNVSTTVDMTRWVNPAISTVPEPEGQNPPTQALMRETYSATLQRYSAAFATSTYNADLSPLDWAKGMADVLKDQILSTRERIRWNAATSGTNVLYNSPAITSRPTVNGVITLGRIQKAVQSIEAAKGMTFTRESSGSTKIGSSPVEAAYVCLAHSNAHPDIRNLPGFTKRAEMTGDYPMGTFGCVDNVIFVTSPEFVPFFGAGAATTTLLATGGNTDVYSFVVLAKDALTDIDLAGNGRQGWGNAETDVLNKADKFDISNARLIVVGWWYDAAVLTSFDWAVRIECGVTANPA